jgi:hypothetical protein
MSYGPAMFCCTTLRDVIFAEWYFVNVISTTGILQHAVVCRVTTVGIRAKALTLGWNLVNGTKRLELNRTSKEFSKNMVYIQLRIQQSYLLVR